MLNRTCSSSKVKFTDGFKLSCEFHKASDEKAVTDVKFWLEAAQ